MQKMYNNVIELDGHRLGHNEKALLIAEISANHDKNIEQALKLVDIAADAGWDCLKLQTYTADSLTMPSKHESMKVDPIWGHENLYELYKAAAMPLEFHEPLFSKARERGLLPFTSIYDPRDLDFIESLGCSLYKIASFEMNYDDLLAEVAQTGKPIVLSTGMSTLTEIEQSLEILDKNRSGEVILLHCCSSYPAPLESINLNAMTTIGQTFGRKTGFSDHTLGSIGALTAISMGAVAVEKHFTNDPNREGPDHRFSATPDIMREIAEGAKNISLLKGSFNKETTEVEKINKKSGRRSAFAVRDLALGSVLKEEDFRFIRPGVGIPPTNKQAIIGKRLKRAKLAGEPILFEDF